MSGLARREGSLITLGLIAALNRPEVELHIHGALRNGCTPDEIKEVSACRGCHLRPYTVPFAFGRNEFRNDPTKNEAAAGSSNDSMVQPSGWNAVRVDSGSL